MIKTIELEPIFAVDSNNNRYKIHVYQEVIITESLNGPASSIEGLLSYRLSDGSTLNRLSDAEFEIVKNGTRVFPRDRKCFTVLRCGCDVKVIGQQKSPAEINQ